jgi:hypothetical protein
MDEIPSAPERIQASVVPPAATGGNFTCGAGFIVTQRGYIDALRYYRYNAGGSAYHELSLWNNAGVKLIGPIADIGGVGTTGWREIPLPSPLAVSSGQTYRVSYASSAYTYFNTAPPASLAPHMAVSGAGYYLAGRDVFPTTAQPANYYPVDVVYRTTSVSGYPKDSKGTNHVGTIGGNPTYGVAGAIAGNTAIDLAIGDWFIIPDAPALDVGNFPWSVEMWMKRGAFGGTYIPFSKANQFEFVWDSSNVMYLGNQSSGNVYTSIAIVDSNWHHYVITRPNASNGTNRWYIDGVDSTGTSLGSAYAANASPLTFGGRGTLRDMLGDIVTPMVPSYGFDGALDEVAIYNVALTPAQILEHYNARNM